MPSAHHRTQGQNKTANMYTTQTREKLWTSNFILAFLGNFSIFFAFYLLLPVLPFYLIEKFNADSTLIGTILASYTLTALLTRPFSGFLVDYFSRKPLLVTCYFVFVGFFAGYIVAGTLLLFAILRAVHGFSFGMVTVSNSTMAIDVMPSSRRNVGIGYYGLSTNIAMALSPTLSLFLHDNYGNYDYIFLCSLLTGTFGLICVSLIKAPEKITSAGEPISLDRFFLLKGIPAGINIALLSFIYGIMSTYVAIYGEQEVHIKSGTGFFFMLMAFGLITSRLLSAGQMNRGHLTRTILLGILFMITGFSCFIFLKTIHFFYLSAFLIGMSYGFVCPAFQAMFINLARHNQRGTANSTYLTCWDIGLGAGVFLGGYIAKASNYTTAYLVGLGLVILGLILFQTLTASYYTHHKLR